MAAEDGWAANPSQRTNYSCNVALKCVEAGLGGYRIMRGDDLLKHEPSAHNPWANTMLGLVFIDIADSCLVLTYDY